MQLTFGGGQIHRILEDVEELLVQYRTDDGLRYLDHRPTTPPEYLVPEDLAVTILINSRVGPDAFKSVQDHGESLRLDRLPDKPFESTNEPERDLVADLIVEVAQWRGFAASVATKILHKKRPALIPILDNQAIFGAYLNPSWPTRLSSRDSVYAKARIKEALEWIAFDLARSENTSIWRQLQEIEPRRSLIEIFDMVWWVYFRSLEPVRPVSVV